jgi:hypothetical protein
MNPYESKDLQKFFESIPSEEIERQSRLQEERNEEMYREFVDAMAKGMCFLCNRPNDSFVPAKFCFHWFLHPTGIRKKHFSTHLNGEVSFFRLDAYLRWIANNEDPVRNINDLTEEISPTSYLETTIRYRNIEWAFSVGHTDKAGHYGGKVGQHPHYHLQMKVDGRIFLRFNDFHIQFTDEDLFTLELIRQTNGKVKAQAFRGEGIGILENERVLEYLADHMTVADDEANAMFRRQTLIEAPEGQTISGDILADAAEESMRTKEPVGQILRRLLPDATITTVIQPGDGVPEMSKRGGKK